MHNRIRWAIACTAMFLFLMTSLSFCQPSLFLATSGTNFTCQMGSGTQTYFYAVINIGSSTLTVTSVSFSGPNAGDFSASPVIPSASIPVGGGSLLLVYFTPLSPGVKNATLNVYSNDPVNNPVSAAIQVTVFNYIGMTGYLINDVNYNGKWDKGETGIPGVDIKLKGVQMDGYDNQTKTSSRGSFRFKKLGLQDYQIGPIIKSLPAGFKSTTGQDVQTVTLTAWGEYVLMFYAKSCDSLSFVEGTPTVDGQGWEKAVDKDTVDQDGTVLARGASPDSSGPAWGVFKFACGQKGIFNALCLKTDNGLPEPLGVPSPQAQKIELWVSDDGVTFDSVTVIDHNSKLWQKYELPKTVIAGYIKLVIVEPKDAVGSWRQLVEFKTDWIVTAPGFMERRLNKQISAEDWFASVMAGIQPREYKLAQNYPNPFNPTTTISFALPQEGQVSLRVFDMNGREVANLVDGVMTAGSHSVEFNAQNLPSGQYIYQLSSGKFKAVKTMTLVK